MAPRFVTGTRGSLRSGRDTLTRRLTLRANEHGKEATVGEKETATAENLGAGSVEGSDARGRTGNQMQMDDDRGVARATSVKSGKSNSSDRVVDDDPIDDSTDDDDTPNRATTVKSSKSNSSERATTVKSSKSNTSD